ncbi:MAG: DUF1294 domain-containing protein [Spirochaetia bacterium]|nr:DUF1294 domain-containing protein [Spirochaetia bacterium]
MNAYEKLAFLLIGWNIITFIAMWIDKRKAIKGKQRISESTFFLLAFAMGAFGVMLGMPIFRHKTGKPFFIIVIVIAFLVNILTFIGMLNTG